jgi:two-component system nitrogen regulation response regulator GlnG
MAHEIIVVDDDPEQGDLLGGLMRRRGLSPIVVESAAQALAALEEREPTAIIADVQLGHGMSGIELCAQVRERMPSVPVIVITGAGSLEVAVEAIRAGAYDFVTKPIAPDALMASVQRAVERRSLQDEVRRLRVEAEASRPIHGILGDSPALREVVELIRRVADSDATVLVNGESGTGKELISRAVHDLGPRKANPFVAINCAAVPAGLLESELFGHVKGAFTGATQAKPGLLSLAEGGTVFLDELADIPLPVQVKLLRVLEHNEVTPVGSNQPSPLNIRILAATHQDLERKIAEGTFRHDLFFRLNVFQIHLPPLRQRRDDIVPLAEHFLRRLDPRLVPLLPQTAQFLTNQAWIGNVRELRNALEHAVIVARGGPLLPEHLPPMSAVRTTNPKEQLAAAVLAWLEDRVQSSGGTTPTNLYDELLKCVEPPLLEELMRRLQGNRLVAAQWLGLNRATVRKKLAEYGLADVHRPPHKMDDDEE